MTNTHVEPDARSREFPLAFCFCFNNMHRKITAILLVESLFLNPKQCNYRSKQFNYIVIALVMNKQNGSQVCRVQ